MKKSTLVGVCTAMLMALAPAVQAGTITIGFDTLTGSNNDAFSSYSESGYTVTATGGDWYKAFGYGNPTPDLFAGPIGSPSASTLRITGSVFNLLGLDLSCNNGSPCGASFSGYSGGNLVASGGVNFPYTGSFVFTTFGSPISGAFDTLDITLAPGVGTSSMNIDNIVLETSQVPEPASLTLLGTGMVAAALRRRRRLAA